MRQTPSHPVSPAEPSAERETPVVLVVDDDANMRFALREGLSAYGFDVDAVHDAASACERAVELRPDVVILDWVLPGGESGAVACRRLHEALPEVPVVMLTGLADVRDQRTALEAGASAFLVKGIGLDALADRLRELLD